MPDHPLVERSVLSPSSEHELQMIHSRLGQLEVDSAAMRSSLSTLRWIAGATLAAVVAWAGWMTVTTIRTESTTATTAREYHEHAVAPRHVGSDQLVVEIRETLAELRTEVRQTREILSEMQARLRVLEQRGNGRRIP